MRKIRLDLEQLRVESFATAADGDPRRGTVRGHDATEAGCIPSQGCPFSDGCDPSDICFPTDLGCGTFGCGTRVMSCNAADCTHEN